MRLPALLLTLAAAMPATAAESKTALVIHGGAGFVPNESLSEADRRDVHATLNRALDAGNKILGAGGSALDAVEAAVLVLEDSPRFNAGKGAVFNAKGAHELDAAIMEGHTRRAGAVAGVSTVRNPIRLARAVMAAGGAAGAVFNAAKEQALDDFIAGRIRFTDMAPRVEAALSDLAAEPGFGRDPDSLDAVMDWDALARRKAAA